MRKKAERKMIKNISKMKNLFIVDANLTSQSLMSTSEMPLEKPCYLFLFLIHKMIFHASQKSG